MGSVESYWQGREMIITAHRLKGEEIVWIGLHLGTRIMV